MRATAGRRRPESAISRKPAPVRPEPLRADRPTASGGDATMALEFIGTTSKDGDCPTLYRDTDTGHIVVQGDRLTDPAHLAQLRDVKPSETESRSSE